MTPTQIQFQFTPPHHPRPHPHLRSVSLPPRSHSQKTRSPPRKTQSPPRKTQSPPRKTQSPSEKAPSPSKKAPSPSKKAPSPSEKAPSPSKKAPSPSKKASTDYLNLEGAFDVSFLKKRQLLIAGDVETNPGRIDNNENTPTKGKGRPKGTPKKSKAFRGTPRKIVTNSLSILSDVGPRGLVNISTDCFFNSVIQALFSLQSFRNHVRNFNAHIHYANHIEINAIHHIQQLLRDMASKRET